MRLILWQLENVLMPYCNGDFLSCRTIVTFESRNEVPCPHLRENTHTIHNSCFTWEAGEAGEVQKGPEKFRTFANTSSQGTPSKLLRT